MAIGQRFSPHSGRRRERPVLRLALSDGGTDRKSLISKPELAIHLSGRSIEISDPGPQQDDGRC